MRPAHVTVGLNAQKPITILYLGKTLPYSIYKQQAKQVEVLDAKQLSCTHLLPTPPASEHPWRTYRKHLNGKPILQRVPLGSD